MKVLHKQAESVFGADRQIMDAISDWMGSIGLNQSLLGKSNLMGEARVIGQAVGKIVALAMMKQITAMTETPPRVKTVTIMKAVKAGIREEVQ
jgi:hypothetical protein